VTDGASAVYVYGILRASDAGALSVEGVSGAPVRVIAHGDLAAVVSDLDSDTLSAAREVRAHWRVLEKAAKDATVLPVRFGTVLEGDGAVREGVLARNEQEIGALLGELAGRIQLSVKGSYDESALLRAVVTQSPAIAALRERTRAIPEQAGYYDQIRLGEMVADEIARRRDDDTRLALDLLEPLAVAALAQPVTGADAAFDLAFLVERNAIDAFSAAVVKLGEQVGDRIAIRYVGPLPPYSFADHEVTTGSAAWA
jgi:gas vesicle protein GvpL/GvpF